MKLPLVNLSAQVSRSELESCSRLAYRIAHDLGNISAAVSGNAELIAKSAASDSSVLRRAGNILTASNYTDELIGHMERFLGHKTHDDAPLEVNELVSDAKIENMQKLFPSAVTLEVRASDAAQLPRPFVSALRIGYCITELLKNSAMAMLERTGTVRLSLTEENLNPCSIAPLLYYREIPPADYLLVSVEDEGEGITAESVPHIFTPAYSTRMRQPGFGLSAIYGIICRQHGGAIGLWSQPGTGTRINLYIPADRQSPGTL